MSENKRRRFQIHLSTAVVMILIGGVLLGLNMANGYVSEYAISGSELPSTRIQVLAFGWPLPCVEVFTGKSMKAFAHPLAR